MGRILLIDHSYFISKHFPAFSYMHKHDMQAKAKIPMNRNPNQLREKVKTSNFGLTKRKWQLLLFCSWSRHHFQLRILSICKQYCKILRCRVYTKLFYSVIDRNVFETTEKKLSRFGQNL